MTDNRQERDAVRHLITTLQEAGFELLGTDDGVERAPFSDVDTTLEDVFGVEEIALVVRKPGHPKRHIYLIPGNGADLIGDFSCGAGDPDGLVALMEKVL